ncbi:hypothetical protein PO124_01190 [Bacillus licheniformis]|nr:hypothetical protein [Bacillus licheniformis]
MIENNKLLEWAEYVGNYYGTPVDYVEQTLESGRDVFLKSKSRVRCKSERHFLKACLSFGASEPRRIENRIVTRGTETEALIETG